VNRTAGASSPRWSQREAVRWFGLGTLLLLALLLVYGASLSLPFFFDDFVHIPFVESHRLREIWATSGGLAYYRPLSFSIWKLMFWIVGRHDPLLQHGLNLGLHLLNALMVAWLAGELWTGRRWFRRAVAGILFLVYPFSYQAVPWIGSMSHLLVTTLILATLIGYWQSRREGRRLWAVASLLLAALAPFAHETGVLIGPLVALAELTDRPSPHHRCRVVGRGLLWSLPALAWLPIWWAAPKSSPAALTLPSIERLWQNGAYFAQGIAYPFSWVGGWLRQNWGVNDLLIATVLSGMGLALAALLQVLRHAGRRSLLPWAWSGLAVLPATLTLTFDYVINGPRLLMLASVGAAWLWTDVLALLLPSQHPRPAYQARQGLVAILFAVLVGQNAHFILERIDLHSTLGQVIEQVVTVATAANQEHRPAAVINFPSWLAPLKAQYALGHEGVLVWPEYAQPASLVRVHTGKDVELSFARWDAVRSEMTLFYGVAGGTPDWPALVAARSDLFLTRYDDRQIQVVPVGTLGVSPPQGEPIGAFRALDGRPVASLIEASAAAQPGGRVLVSLLWRASGAPPDTTVFVHLLDSRGELLAQADGDPFGGLLPLDRWPADLIAWDLRLADPVPAATVQVGLYDRSTGERMSVVASDGQVCVDQAVSLKLDVP
jgi:hypothetical protein